MNKWTGDLKCRICGYEDVFIILSRDPEPIDPNNTECPNCKNMSCDVVEKLEA